MKRFTIVFVCLLTVSLSSLAQTAETLDLATFQSPVGWKRQVKDGDLIFNTSNEQKATYAMIMIYLSGDSSGNAKSDFESAVNAQGELVP